jgi:extradiol dioxygenase family protein
MLQHIALTINDSKEIERFYQDILQCTIKHKFTINEEITLQVFNFRESADVCLMVYEDIDFEIFIASQREKKVFSHISLAYRNAEQINNKAVQSGYKSLIRSNAGSHTYFIWDKSGNMFEIKEAAE